MKHIKHLLLCLFLLVPSLGFTEYAKAGQTTIWYETFGAKEDRPLLLIMGGMCQGLLWPEEFCQQLADEGFYVIRYDNRDTGYSSCYDFATDPYTLLDMAKDAAGLLDHLEINHANVCGMSMGGPISELLSVHFPEKVASLTLLSTSSDLRPCMMAFEGHPLKDYHLSSPSQAYMDWMQQFLHHPSVTYEEKLEERVECWRILNGELPYDEPLHRKMHAQFLDRLLHPESMLNHLYAIKASFDMICAVHAQVKAPTVVIHGDADPILRLDHGQALHAALPGSKLVVLKGYGHVPNSMYYRTITDEIKSLSVRLN